MLESGVCSLMCRDCSCHSAGSRPPLSLLPGDDVRVEQFLRRGRVGGSLVQHRNLAEVRQSQCTCATTNLIYWTFITGCASRLGAELSGAVCGQSTNVNCLFFSWFLRVCINLDESCHVTVR